MVLKNWMFVVSLVLIAVGGALAISSALLMLWPLSVADETFVVPPLSARALCRSFSSGSVLTIYVDVLSGGNRDINLWIMSEEDYYSFMSGRGYSYYTEFPRVSERTIEWSPPTDRRICIVYDNTFSIITSKTVYTKVSVKLYTWSTLIAGEVILIAGIVMVIVYRQRLIASQKQRTSNQAQPA